ncbi:MAG TPA: TIGR02678 family protein [Pseudonocardiaceae bacterium]|nr:TIGR02678 family protein [Pseudonocardiaceae bacterium]
MDAANVVRCARVLLRRPLLRVGGADGDLLPLVFRHRAALADLFTQTLGYRLVVQRQFARLYKAIPGTDLPRAEAGLTPTGYAYLALTIAALTGAGRQVLLSRLVADVRAAAGEAGVAADDDVANRRTLAAALRHLLGLGVITETEGTVTGLVGETPSEALITIDTDLLGQLLVGPLTGAESVDDLLTLAARPGPRGVEHSVRRRLVEDPVTHYADLPAEQADWLRRRARRESALLERCFGLITESRAEGIVVTDPEDYLTDLVFPGASTVARIALLVLPELLADEQPELATDDPGPQRRSDGRVPVTVGQVRLACQRLVSDYPAAWSKQATEDIAELADDVLALLASAGLALPGEDGWLISPAAHRWQPVPDERPAREIPVPEATPEPEPGWSLFDEEGCA